jgi:hypothetical protein
MSVIRTVHNASRHISIASAFLIALFLVEERSFAQGKLACPFTHKILYNSATVYATGKEGRRVKKRLELIGPWLNNLLHVQVCWQERHKDSPVQFNMPENCVSAPLPGKYRTFNATYHGQWLTIGEVVREIEFVEGGPLHVMIVDKYYVDVTNGSHDRHRSFTLEVCAKK